MNLYQVPLRYEVLDQAISEWVSGASLHQQEGLYFPYVRHCLLNLVTDEVTCLGIPVQRYCSNQPTLTSIVRFEISQPRQAEHIK